LVLADGYGFLVGGLRPHALVGGFGEAILGGLGVDVAGVVGRVMVKFLKRTHTRMQLVSLLRLLLRLIRHNHDLLRLQVLRLEHILPRRHRLRPTLLQVNCAARLESFRRSEHHEILRTLPLIAITLRDLLVQEILGVLTRAISTARNP